MEETSSSSPDLFHPSGAAANASPADRVKSLFKSQTDPRVTVSLEVLTAFFAVAIVLLVLTFYLGFQRGRNMEHKEIQRKVREFRSMRPAQPSYGTPVQSALGASTLVSQAPQTPQPIANTQVTSALNSVAKTGKKPYTIQVVSYRTQTQADKEASQLMRQGFAVKVSPQGAYFVVCVGEYANRAEADKDLRALKKIYNDSYLRKI